MGGCKLLASELDTSVIQAVGQYVTSMRTKESQSVAQQHLMRFVQWCGAERALSDVRPSEVGEYGEKAVGSSGGAQAVERLQGIRKFLSYARKQGIIDQNLAQHLRIRKGKARSIRTAAAAKIAAEELTAQGHRELVSELEKLQSEREPIAREIRRAAADKDVRENVPLEAAREQLGHVESRIREIENTLRVSVVTGPRRGVKTVGVGAKVLLKDLNNGRETRYTVVSASEAKPLERRISNVSPVGSALMSKTAGQEIEVETPGGKLKYRIVRVTS